jgi:YfiH family protein
LGFIFGRDAAFRLHRAFRFSAMKWQTFPSLLQPGFRHGFSSRSSGALADLDNELAESLAREGYPVEDLVQAEQMHGNGVACVQRPERRVPGVDALVTRQAHLPLVIRVADCGPVYFWDPVQKAAGLAHSGRKGTALNIVGATIRALHKHFGSKPHDLIVQLGPCIRPPHYEVAFAEEIGRQAAAEGATQYADCGICTACHLDRYYSYRAEKGQTGRMWAVAMITE